MKFPLKELFSLVSAATFCVSVVAGEPGGALRFVDADAVSVAAVEPASAIQQVGFHGAACGCETYPNCGCEVAAAPNCGCETSCGGACYGHKRHFPILHMLGLDNCCHRDSCCATPTCAEPACGVEPTCAAPCADPTCGVDTACASPCAAPTCGVEVACATPCAAPCSHSHCGKRRSLLDVLFHCKKRGCCDYSCSAAPSCGCEAVDASCGCEPACAEPACGCETSCASSCSGGCSSGCGHRHGILGLLGWHRCHGRSYAGCCTQVACASPACGVESSYAAPVSTPSYTQDPMVAPIPTTEPTPALPSIDDVPPTPVPSPSDLPPSASTPKSKWYTIK